MKDKEHCITDEEFDWVKKAVGPQPSPEDENRFHLWLEEQVEITKAISLLKKYGFLVSRII